MFVSLNPIFSILMVLGFDLFSVLCVFVPVSGLAELYTVIYPVYIHTVFLSINNTEIQKHMHTHTHTDPCMIISETRFWPGALIDYQIFQV